MRNIAENLAFTKSNSSEKVDAAQWYLLRKSTSSINVLTISPPKRSVLRKVPTLKNYLFSISSCSVEVVF